MSATRPGQLLRHLHPADPDDRSLLARFAGRRDPAAFAALVRRHGPMVYAVCRRVTGHPQDAEDAFQAAFLVLARSAGSVRNPDRLGAWLYGVAAKVAGRARRTAARRRRREVQAAVFPDIPVTDDPPPLDIGPILHEELAALPAHHREPIVLCDLQGLSRADAATALGVPEGTLSSRLANGRKRLADRLTRRGVALTLAAVPGAVAHGRGVVPEALISNTCGLVAAWAAGEVVPAAVLRLARGGFPMRSVLLGGVLSLSLAAGAALAAGLADPPAADPPRLPAPPAVAVAAAPEAEAQPKKDAAPAPIRAPRLERMEDLSVRQARTAAWNPTGEWLVATGYTGEAAGPAGAAPAAGVGRGPGFGGEGPAGLGGKSKLPFTGGNTSPFGKNTLALVPMKDRRTAPTYAPLPAASRLVGFTTDGKHFLTETHEAGLISGAHTVQFWEVSSRPLAPKGAPAYDVAPGRVREVAAGTALFTPTPDGNALRYLVRQADKAGIRKVEVRHTDLRNNEDWSLGTFEGTFRTTQFTPDGGRVVVVTEAGEVEVYSAEGGKRQWASAPAAKFPDGATFSGPSRGPTPTGNFVAIARDGSRMLVARGRSRPVVLDGATGRDRPALEGVDVVDGYGSPAVSADGRLAALAYGPIEKLPPDEAKKVTPLAGAGMPVFERGSTRLTVWDTTTGKVVRTWSGGSPLALAFHPTRPLLAILEANGSETRLGLWEFSNKMPDSE